MVGRVAEQSLGLSFFLLKWFYKVVLLSFVYSVLVADKDFDVNGNAVFLLFSGSPGFNMRYRLRCLNFQAFRAIEIAKNVRGEHLHKGIGRAYFPPCGALNHRYENSKAPIYEPVDERFIV